MSEKPYTTEELSESELGSMALPDQIRYAIYNQHYYLSDIVDIVTFSGDWTTDIIEDMVDEGELHEGDDDNGVFYELPDEQSNRGLDDDEREAVHEKARVEYRSSVTVGDEDDVKSAYSDETSDTDTSAASEGDTEPVDAHGKAAMDSGTSTTDDTVASTDRPETTAADDKPAWYRDLEAHKDDLEHELPDWEDIVESRAKNGGRLPVDRDYDWDEEKLDPTRVDEYVDADGEKADIEREIEDRRETGKLGHFRIVGPTGCGKTTIGENVADDMSAPCFMINCHEGLRPNNLLGMPTYVGDETWWVDGPLTKALIASKDRPAVVIFDEVNRTTARTLGVIMSALDHRAEVTLNARGGETVQGDPMNLIVFSTMNEGDGYVVNQIDRAQLRRLGNTFETDYIGMYDIEEEAELITDRTPVSKGVATEMVECANAIRKKANGDGNVSMGIPTSTMLDWARTAWTYRDDDVDGGPLIKAGHRAVLNTFFRGDESEEDIVTTTLESHLRGMPVGDEETSEELEEKADEDDTSESIDLSDDTWLMCESCGFYTDVEDASEDVVTTMQCPECDDTLVPKEAA